MKQILMLKLVIENPEDSADQYVERISKRAHVYGVLIAEIRPITEDDRRQAARVGVTLDE